MYVEAAILSHHSFYTLDEYFEYSSWKIDCIQGCFYVPQLIILLRLIYLLASILNYNHIDLVLCTASFVLTFPHPGLYLILWKYR
jgi:hypothetical protein